MKRLRLRALFLVAILVLSSLPAATAVAQARKRFKFVVITHSTATPFFVPVRKGAEDAARLLGCDIVFMGPAGFDIERQVELLKSAVAQKVDGIACTLPDPTAFSDAVQEAASKGVPVIAINADAPRSGRLAYIGQGNYDAGRSMGQQIIKLLPKGGDVIIAVATPGAENLEARIKGVQDVLADHGDFAARVVATASDLAKAEGLIAGALQADPNVKGMFGVEGTSGTAIAHIIERQSIAGRVFGGGFDLVTAELDAIEKGSLQFTIDQQPYLQGFQGVVELWLNRMYSLSPVDIDTGTAPVTAASVAAVKALAAKGFR